MHIAVIGAGVIGVTTAYELACDGHQVTLIDRASSVASQTSFANAGVVSPGYAAPWSAPGMPAKVLAGFAREHAAVRLQGLGGPRTWAWLWRFWRACEARGYARRRAQMLALARESQSRLHELTRTLGLDWERRRGYLVLLRTPSDVARARPSIEALRDAGLNVTSIDAAACRAIEPGLNPATPLAAGLHWPDDDIGNCRQFTLQLLDHALARGARLRLGHEVRRLCVEASGVTLRIDASKAREGPPASRITHYPASDEPDAGAGGKPDTDGLSRRQLASDPSQDRSPGDAAFDATFDAVVVCAGATSASLLRRVHVHVPLLAVNGYSLTAPLKPSQDPLVENQPRSGLMDEAYKVAISRIGERVRLAGSAEIGGRADHLSPAPVATLYKVLDDWFPTGAQRSMATPWKGARPMLPDGPPIIGATRHARLWLNLGHGSSGWALACGSARLLADRIAGHSPSVDPQGFTLDRFG